MIWKIPACIVCLVSVQVIAVSCAENESSATVVPQAQRIVGGFQINITDAPYQVSVQFEDEHACGGAIISKYFILTAAHCTYTDKNAPETIQVLVGQTEANFTSNTFGERFKVNRVFEHEQFNRSTLDYDVTLLRLNKPIKYSHTKRTVKMATKEDIIVDGTLCMVSGWGLTQDESKDPNLLRATIVPYVSRKRCRVFYPNDITSRMICAGYDEGGKDSCTNDSGGPLVCNGKLFGVVSWGFKCAEVEKPGVYAQVSLINSWAKKLIKNYTPKKKNKAKK